MITGNTIFFFLSFWRDGMRKIAMLISLFIATVANAAPPILIDQKTGQYLGNLSTNQHDPDSVSNPHGRYGSKDSEDSINNPNGKYGDPQSNDSPNNPYATNAPIVLDQEDN
tara:strand:- start:83 stop:418 length:336 start_codon:yes stop_codon:yes gene_type:complete